MIITSCFSQNSSGKGDFLLSVSAGVSFPTEPFHASNVYDNKLLATRTGYIVNVSCNYKLDEVLGISADIYHAGYPPGKNPGHQPAVQGQWHCSGILTGPAMSIISGRNLYITIKTSGGISLIKAAGIVYNGIVYSNIKTSCAFTLQMGTDLNYTLGKNYFLFLHAGYAGMSPSFSLPGVITGKITEEIQVLHITTGIGIRL